MCGIVGFFQKESLDPSVFSSIETLKHRGPDSLGACSFKDNNVFFAHSRLAILDLSDNGKQPYTSPNKKYTIVFNGEIYNHLELRNELNETALPSYNWNGCSDTETLAVGFESWGIKETIVKCTGMFAIAIWNHEEETITLVRDRFGEKPLYYGWGDGVFMFGSELKALKAHHGFINKISKEAVALYFRYGYIPTPYSIYQDVFKLEPATILVISSHLAQIDKFQYWNLEEHARKKKSKMYDHNERDILEKLLKKSIKSQTISDVPLGAFLSGGIDSTTVVAILQSVTKHPVKTFTIGFDDAEYNEADHASEIADLLKTDHTELIMSPLDVMRVIDQLPQMYDEPFSDHSQIATFLVSKLAKSKVSVILSGDGGDELFCGYNRYLYTEKAWGKIKYTPFFLRKFFAYVLINIPTSIIKKISTKFKLNNFESKIQKIAKALPSKSLFDLYHNVIIKWSDNDKIVKNFTIKDKFLLNKFNYIKDLNAVENMMLWDSKTYLTDDILVKNDRASMRVSLECRAPFLDHNIYEYAWSLPLSSKCKNGIGKQVLRDVLYKYVPKELVHRPKQGFSLPISEWLRGPLKNWAKSLLSQEEIEKQNILDFSVIDKKWKEHLSEKKDWSEQLWTVLIFQLWMKDNSAD